MTAAKKKAGNTAALPAVPIKQKKAAFDGPPAICSNSARASRRAVMLNNRRKDTPKIKLSQIF